MLVQDELPGIRGLLALVGAGVPPVGAPLPQVCGPVALVRDPVALIREPLTLIRKALSLVCETVSLVSEPPALDPVTLGAPGRRPQLARRRALTRGRATSSGGAGPLAGGVITLGGVGDAIRCFDHTAESGVRPLCTGPRPLYRGCRRRGVVVLRRAVHETSL